MTEEKTRKGTRCAVCVMCGRCFETDDSQGSDSGSSKKWTGTRCDVCVSCGKCAEAWGLIPSGDEDADSGPTNWADAFKVMDIGTAGAPPPVPAAPGASKPEDDTASKPVDSAQAASRGDEQADPDASAQSKPSSFACLKRGADGEEPDTSTGATPGVSAACKEHGFDDMDTLLADRGIKPPGVA